MRIGIIGAMQEEICLLRQMLSEVTVETVGSHEYILGKLHAHEIVLCQSGIGKVCAANAALVLILKYQVESLINTGCAGGIGKDVKIGDIVLSNALAYHDVDVTMFGYKRGQVPKYEQIFKADALLANKALEAGKDLISKGEITHNIALGMILTGDQFISQKAKCLEMLKDFPAAQMVEMEGAAVAHVCHDFKVPCLVIRSASDTADGESPEVFEEFVQLAADNSAKLIQALVAQL